MNSGTHRQTNAGGAFGRGVPACCVVVALVACIPLSPARADDAQATDLEPVVVTGEVQDRGATDIDLADYTGFARVIERGAFADRFVEMSTLLDQLPGVQVATVGGVGSFSTLSLRGSTGKQVNVYLDGVLLNGPASGRAEVNRIPSVVVDRVVVYPDFTPVQLGSANLAGAVNFVTRQQPQDSWGGELRGTLGSFGTRNAEASVWGDVGGWDIIGAASGTDADNDFPVDSDQFRTNSRHRRNDAYQQRGAFVRGVRGWSGGRLHLLVQHDDADKQLPTALNRRRDAATLATRSSRLQSVLDYDVGPIDIGHRLVVLRGDERFDDRSDTVGLGANLVDTDRRAVGAFNALAYSIAGHDLVAGLDWRVDDFEQVDRLGDQRLVDARRQSAVLAVSDVWSPAARWRLNAVARYTVVDDRVQQFERGFRGTDRTNVASAQIGAAWQATDRLSWKANLGRGVRVPTLNEKFGARGLFEGDPDLAHETSVSADTGIALATDHWAVDASVFARDVRDAIITIFDSRGIGQPRNIGASRRYGVETRARWTPRGWIDLQLGATLIDSENRSRIKSAAGKQLPGIYHQRANAGVTLHHGFARWSLNLRHSDGSFYDTANGVEADAKTDLSSALTLGWRRYTLNVAVDNLLDDNFLDVNRFPTPGRAVRATVTAHLE